MEALPCGERHAPAPTMPNMRAGAFRTEACLIPKRDLKGLA